MSSIVVGNLKAILSLDTTNFDKGATSSEANAKKLADRLSKDLAPSQARINSLIRDFAGNRDIARALEMATAVEKIGGANKLTASEQAKTNRVVQEAIEKYRVLGVEAPKHLTDLAKATKQVQRPTEELGAGMTGLIGKAKSLAGIFGVTLGAGALVGFAKQAFDAADKIGDLALKMGVSTDAAQRFQFAARQSGADIENVSQAIVTMNRNLADGDKSTVAALDAASLKFSDIRGQKPEEAFRSIADAIARIPDPMLQSKVAMELFGKSGAELLPMIREQSLKAADGIDVMSDTTVNRLKDAKQAWENFWNGLTVISAGAIVGIMDGWNKMIADLRTGLMFLARFSTGGLTFAIEMGQAEAVAQQFQKGKPMRDLQADLSAPSAMSSHGPKSATFLTKEEQEAIDRKAKDATSAQARLNEQYRAFERERLTGVTDAQRQAKAYEMRFLSDRGLLDASAWSKSIVSKTTDWDQLTGGGITFSKEIGGLLRNTATNNAPLPDFPSLNPNAVGSIGRPMDLGKLTKGGLSVADLMGGAKIPADRLKTLFGAGVGGFSSQLPQTIIQALSGGGNVGKSVGSLFGGQIGTSLMGTAKDGLFQDGLGKMLQGSFLGKKIGGMVGNLIPGLGALLGPVMGKLFGAITGLFANKTKQAREDFAKKSGFESLDNLYGKLRSLGSEGGALANFGQNAIGKKDTRANEKWMKDVTAFFDRLEKVPGKVQELSSALGRFGGAIPSQLDPLLDSILGDSNLSADLKKQLEGLRKPTWQAADELRQSFGIREGALGAGFNQSRVADSAFNLKRAIDVFGKFAGSDQNAILRDMADEFSGVAGEAKKTGVALPKAVEAFIRQIDEMGLLLDENGERIDASLLMFADIEDEYQKQVVSLLEQIRDLLSGKAGGASGATGSVGVDADGKLTVEPRTGYGDPEFALPGFAGGTHGQYMDFGAGTPVMLHGQERVMTAGEDAGGGRMMTVIFERDGRAEATWLMPFVAGEVKRLGMAR